MRVYLALIALIAWLGLILQFILVFPNSAALSVPISTAIVNYFSFFTILSNLFVAVVLTAALLRPPSRVATPRLATAAAVYITVVGLTYSLVLRNLWNPQGLQKAADIVLHDAVPVLYLTYWFLVVARTRLRWRDALAWLPWPGVYLAYSLGRGAMTGWYPYPFIDAAMHGYTRVLANIGVLALVFVALSLLFIAITRVLTRTRSHSPRNA